MKLKLVAKKIYSPLLSEEALKILMPFSTIYLCKAGFFAAVVFKTKAHSKL